MHNLNEVRTNIIEERDAAPVQQTFKRKTAPDGLSQEGLSLLNALGGEPLGAEILMQKCGLDVALFQTALTELEIYDLIKVCPGRTFILK